MKSFLKKSFVFFVVFVFALSSCLTFAKNDSEKLYEKYNYNENFEYDDVTIAHALKSSVVLIFLDYVANVEYTQAEFDIEGIKEEIEELYDEYSYYYTKEEFAEMIVEDMIYNISDYIEWGYTKEVPVEASWRGSGVVIDESGYVATNSHVVSLTEENKHYACMEYLHAGIMEDLDKVIEELELYDIPITEDQEWAVYNAALEEIITTAEITDEENILYVCFPSASGETSLGDDRTIEAKVVANGVSLEVSNDGTTQDAAILEINSDNLVALKLSDSYPEVNSKIVSAGFPADADAIFAQDMGSAESILSVTVGSGNIARLIPIDGHSYKALEITTTISGGNSGGPSVDKNLNIEGLNTYGTYTGQYAYMVPAEYVAELADGIDLKQDEVTLTFLTGLQMLQQNYGAAALECFEEVQNINDHVPYIEHLILLAKKAPQNYPDGTMAKNDNENSKDSDYTMIAIIGGAALVVVILVVFLITVSKKKKSKVSVPVRYDIPVSDETHITPMSGTAPTPPSAPTFGSGGYVNNQNTVNQIHNSAPVKTTTTSSTIATEGFGQLNSHMTSKPDAPGDLGTAYGTPMSPAPETTNPKPNTTPGKFIGNFKFGGTTPGFINQKPNDDK